MNQKYLRVLFYTGLWCLLGACSDVGGSDEFALAQNPQGQGGSLARMSIQGNFLHIVGPSELISYDVSQAQDPKFINTHKLEHEIETIFPYENRLFIGTTTGMYIYETSTGGVPQFISFYEHIYSCDPVVVKGDYAYATLRGGSTCRNGFSRLEVIDISHVESPFMVTNYGMFEPYGLGVRDTLLVVCEKEYGLKYYDLRDPAYPQELGTLSSLKAIDVIPQDFGFIFTGESGIDQYTYQVDSLNRFEWEWLSSIR